MTEAQYLKLKKEVQEAQAAYERAKGAWQELLTRLREEFQVGGLDDAMKLLDQLAKEEKEAGAAVEKAYQEFVQKWKI
jgi:hypothetical protein